MPRLCKHVDQVSHCANLHHAVPPYRPAAPSLCHATSPSSPYTYAPTNRPTTPTTSESGASECALCITEYYKDGDECKVVPAGVQVEDGSVGMTLESLKVEEGYFRLSTDTATIYECPYPANWYGIASQGGISTVGRGHPTPGTRHPTLRHLSTPSFSPPPPPHTHLLPASATTFVWKVVEACCAPFVKELTI